MAAIFSTGCFFGSRPFGKLLAIIWPGAAKCPSECTEKTDKLRGQRWEAGAAGKLVDKLAMEGFAKIYAMFDLEDMFFWLWYPQESRIRLKPTAKLSMHAPNERPKWIGWYKSYISNRHLRYCLINRLGLLMFPRVSMCKHTMNKVPFVITEYYRPFHVVGGCHQWQAPRRLKQYLPHFPNGSCAGAPRPSPAPGASWCFAVRRRKSCNLPGSWAVWKRRSFVSLVDDPNLILVRNHRKYGKDMNGNEINKGCASKCEQQ